MMFGHKCIDGQVKYYSKNVCVRCMDKDQELVESKPPAQINDPVNQPNHYTYGDIEVIDYIKDKLTREQFEGYCIGNVMKYTSRYRHKGGVEDLKKANVYLNWAIEAVEE